MDFIAFFFNVFNFSSKFIFLNHRTRAVQKVIETLKTQEQVFMIVSSLKSGMVTLMKNVNGNHVAQHCLDYLMPSSEVRIIFSSSVSLNLFVSSEKVLAFSSVV